jgi:galactokinase
MLTSVRSLAESGLSDAAASSKTALFARCRQALDEATGSARARSWFVPGRIEVLGKHTDYAGGRSLLCAAEAGFCIVARPRADDRVCIIAAETGERISYPLDPGIEPQMGHWSNYPATVMRRVARNFPAARRGADLVFASDLPPAAGMSSSSALMIAVFLALAGVNDLSASETFRASIDDRFALAGYLATIENGRTFRALTGDLGVGTFGGSEDHTAILCCRSGHLSRFLFGPVRFEADVALPAEWTFVVASSGVIAEKTGAARAAYNRASQLAGDVLAAWNRATGRGDPTLEAAVTSDPGAREHMMTVLRQDTTRAWPADVLVARAEQFCLESLDLIPAASAALGRGDVYRFGEIVDESQRAAEQWLGNQVPETVFLAASARPCGAVAASAFGAGFGGSVWALVSRAEADVFRDRWHARYVAAFPMHAARAAFVTTRPGPPAFALD